MYILFLEFILIRLFITVKVPLYDYEWQKIHNQF